MPKASMLNRCDNLSGLHSHRCQPSWSRKTWCSRIPGRKSATALGCDPTTPVVHCTGLQCAVHSHCGCSCSQYAALRLVQDRGAWYVARGTASLQHFACVCVWQLHMELLSSCMRVYPASGPVCLEGNHPHTAVSGHSTGCGNRTLVGAQAAVWHG